MTSPSATSATSEKNSGVSDIRGRSEIHIRNAKKSYSGRVVVDIDDLVLGDQPIEGLLGPNGAGKTTLMRMVMHSTPLDEGSVILRRRSGDVELSSMLTHEVVRQGVVKSTQVISDFDELTVLDSMLLASASARHESPIRTSSEKALAADSMDKIQHYLDFFGFSDPSALAGSAGEKKLLDIVRCLLLEPDVLLLDEPTAGLPEADTKKVMRAVRDLAANGTSVVIVEHDLDVIWELCDEVTFMAEGRVLMKGDPDEIRSNATVVEKYLGAGHG